MKLQRQSGGFNRKALLKLLQSRVPDKELVTNEKLMTGYIDALPAAHPERRSVTGEIRSHETSVRYKMELLVRFTAEGEPLLEPRTPKRNEAVYFICGKYWSSRTDFIFITIVWGFMDELPDCVRIEDDPLSRFLRWARRRWNAVQLKRRTVRSRRPSVKPNLKVAV